MEPLGFKGADMYSDSNWHNHWYRTFRAKGIVIGVSCLIPHGLFIFKLTPRQMTSFVRGKLSLVPPGCCHASGGKHTENYEWVHQGEFKDSKALKNALARTGCFPELSTPSLPPRRPAILAADIEFVNKEEVFNELSASKAAWASLIEEEQELMGTLDCLRDQIKMVRRKIKAAAKAWDAKAAEIVG
jgi:hypothetical protein